MRVQRFGLWIATSLVLGSIVVGQAAAAEDEYVAIRERLETCVACHGERLESIETTLVAVNLPVLKQKVTALEERVTQLEAKQQA